MEEDKKESKLGTSPSVFSPLSERKPNVYVSTINIYIYIYVLTFIRAYFIMLHSMPHNPITDKLKYQ